MNSEHSLLEAHAGLTQDKFQKQPKAVQGPHFNCPKSPSWASQALNLSPCSNLLIPAPQSPWSYLLKALTKQGQEQSYT